MAAQTAPYPYTSPSSSLNGRTWKYDVFLSFRGEDTRNTFTDHLYHALLQRRVIVYRDNEPKRGDNISQVVYKALEQSRISIVILSSNYANSKWCLDELSKIIECMNGMRQRVLPVFYDVEPSEVRKQTGTFGNAFAEHEQVFRDNREKVLRWRDALYQVANLSGFVIRNRYESEVISQILKMVLNALPQVLSHGFLVGIDSRVEEIHVLLDLESNDVRFIGIWGMGGIGKTTIAEVIFQKISAEFEIFTYVPNIREATNEQGGLLQLQKNLLSEALMQINLDVPSVDEGARMIRNSLCNRKVLLILDDVDHLDQLESLAGNQNWFGSGSRVIITTRNEKLLRDHGVENIFEVEELNDNESLQLFSYGAFKSHKPPEDYLDLSKLVVNYARGIPLALVVLGSLLRGRNVTEWISALQRLKEIPHREVFDVLKISYDGLQNNEKRIFLDIACFLKGMDKERVEEILDYFGFNPKVGIQVLIEKSLITILNNRVLMNGFIQDMGRQLVRREYVDEPGKRSRLWLFDDIIYVLNNNKGTNAVEGIALNLPKLKAACWNSESFSNMQNLRFLKIHNLQMTQGPEYLPNALKFLEWSGYPSKFLPQGFQPEELCELNLCHSSIGQLWRGTKGIPYAGNRFEAIFPGSEISEWFSYRSDGPVVSTDLPHHWYKNRWMGYALCVVFVLRRRHPPNLLGKWKYGTHSTAHGLRCEVRPGNLGEGGRCPFFGCSEELGQIESEHIWLSFVSGEYFGTSWQDSCRHLEFSFKSIGPGLELKRCGVRFLYEKDLVGTKQ